MPPQNRKNFPLNTFSLRFDSHSRGLIEVGMLCALGPAKYTMYKPAASISTSSIIRYATWTGDGSKIPSSFRSCSNFLKSWTKSAFPVSAAWKNFSLSVSGSYGRLGRSLRILFGRPLLKWKDLNASLASEGNFYLENYWCYQKHKYWKYVVIAYLNVVLQAPTEEILDSKSFIYPSLQHARYDVTVVDAAFSMLP